MTDIHKSVVSCIAAAIVLGSIGTTTLMAQGNSGKYQVVINHEEQYSIWPVDAKPEKGWRAVGYPCVKYECMEYIDKVWTEKRPPSIGRFVDQQLVRARKNGYRVD